MHPSIFIAQADNSATAACTWWVENVVGQSNGSLHQSGQDDVAETVSAPRVAKVRRCGDLILKQTINETVTLIGSANSATTTISTTNESSVHSQSQQQQQLQQQQQQQQRKKQLIVIGGKIQAEADGQGLKSGPPAVSLTTRRLVTTVSASSSIDPLIADREKRKIERILSESLLAQKKDQIASTRNVVKPPLSKSKALLTKKR